jgi:hypothetical protein
LFNKPVQVKWAKLDTKRGIPVRFSAKLAIVAAIADGQDEEEPQQQAFVEEVPLEIPKEIAEEYPIGEVTQLLVTRTHKIGTRSRL